MNATLQFEIFKTKYGACYQENSTKWVCDCSFNSWIEADEYSQGNNKYLTTLISINNIWPKFTKSMIISSKFKPIVKLE